ncbi:ATP-binding protein [Streptomyces sp. RS10V-4]|uniref:ATP-binding protein n=1 Tax=Streptomyces rhizoryzae TaxID=2932493 RepID=UPI00200304B4|nr:ATP-binding protein [Streptomyces rhizoryzae]MCK7624131.1 ATP-binding protein [Streptomyces rhizoryzae]
MSLPVTRRIARAALLVAAGAAPVVAAAGSASAVDLPPKGNELGGLTTLDSANTSKTLDRTARTGVGLVNETGTQAAHTLAPALVKTLGPVVEKAAPLTQEAADRTEGVVRPVAKRGISTNTLATDAVKGLVGSPEGLLKPATGLLGGH